MGRDELVWNIAYDSFSGTGLARASPLQPGKYRTYGVTRSSNHLFERSHKEGFRFELGMEVP
ncbi:hypothetical protein ABIA24_005407 [Sinorhizobium fredii]|nr:hypothetical protein EFR01_58750 [Sinorhizobium fredii]